MSTLYSGKGCVPPSLAVPRIDPKELLMLAALVNLRLPMSPLEFLDDVITSSTGTRTWTSSIGLGYEEFRLPN